MRAKLVIFALLFCIAFELHNCSEFLQEKPTFLQTCQREAEDFSTCMIKAFQNMFTSWKDGIAGVEHSEPIDPLFVPEFAVIEDRENVTPITVKIHNITVTGLSKAVVKSLSFKNNDYDFKMSYFVPKVRLEGHYTGVGQVLLLRLNTSGEMFMDIEEGLYTISTKMKLRTHENEKFFDLKSLQFTINSIENIKLYFDNLFKDKALNDNTNAVFNASWRTFYDMFKPKIEQEIRKVLLKHFRTVFENVPAKFFIENVE